MANLGQARENREFVRRLLKDKQPGFAAAVELAARELTESCAHPRRCGRPGLTRRVDRDPGLKAPWETYAAW